MPLEKPSTEYKLDILTPAVFLIVDRAALVWRDERIIINGKHRSGSRRLAWRLVLPSHGGCAAQDGA